MRWDKTAFFIFFLVYLTTPLRAQDEFPANTGLEHPKYYLGAISLAHNNAELLAMHYWTDVIAKSNRTVPNLELLQEKFSSFQAAKDDTARARARSSLELTLSRLDTKPEFRKNFAVSLGREAAPVSWDSLVVGPPTPKGDLTDIYRLAPELEKRKLALQVLQRSYGDSVVKNQDDKGFQRLVHRSVPVTPQIKEEVDRMLGLVVNNLNKPRELSEALTSNAAFEGRKTLRTGESIFQLAATLVNLGEHNGINREAAVYTQTAIDASEILFKLKFDNAMSKLAASADLITLFLKLAITVEQLNSGRKSPEELIFERLENIENRLIRLDRAESVHAWESMHQQYINKKNDQLKFDHLVAAIERVGNAVRHSHINALASRAEAIEAAESIDKGLEQVMRSVETAATPKLELGKQPDDSITTDLRPNLKPCEDQSLGVRAELPLSSEAVRFIEENYVPESFKQLKQTYGGEIRLCIRGLDFESKTYAGSKEGRAVELTRFLHPVLILEAQYRTAKSTNAISFPIRLGTRHRSVADQLVILENAEIKISEDKSGQNRKIRYLQDGALQHVLAHWGVSAHHADLVLKKLPKPTEDYPSRYMGEFSAPGYTAYRYLIEPTKVELQKPMEPYENITIEQRGNRLDDMRIEILKSHFNSVPGKDPIPGLLMDTDILAEIKTQKAHFDSALAPFLVELEREHVKSKVKPGPEFSSGPSAKRGKKSFDWMAPDVFYTMQRLEKAIQKQYDKAGMTIPKNKDVLEGLIEKFEELSIHGDLPTFRTSAVEWKNAELIVLSNFQTQTRCRDLLSRLTPSIN